jgi:hypothetical protein
MKYIKYILLVLALTAPMLRAQMPPAFPGGGAQPNAGGDQNNSDNEIIPPGMINFEGVDVRQVLEVYSHLVNKYLENRNRSDQGRGHQGPADGAGAQPHFGH